MSGEPRPYYQDEWLTVLEGDCRAVMREMEPESVHCVVTSPPYWGLRDYGTATWEGGDAGCDHRLWGHAPDKPTPGGRGGSMPKQEVVQRVRCRKCGATRIDAQLGLEPTPEEYVAALVDVFRAVRRVLRADGTVWLNLGDSYAGSSQTGGDGATSTLTKGGKVQAQYGGSSTFGLKRPLGGLKPKDLVGIPWRVAFALQADGWYLRSDIIWAKPNPMPESVTDRPTKSHEMIFLLAKSARYYFDADAVREGIGEARVVERTNGHDERLVLGQDGRLERAAAHSNAVGVRLAAAVLDLAQRNDHLRLSSLDPQIWQERGDDGDGSRAVGDPVMGRAAAEASRFADGDVSAKEFLREVDRLCVALPDGHDLKELRTRAGFPTAATVPLVYPDRDAAVAVNDAREVSQLQLIHDTEYTAALTHSSRRNPTWQERKAAGATAGSLITGHNASHGAGLSHDLGHAAGRNLRSVWIIATAPYPGAHFATFPPALVMPCIKAGTSERGVCPECGAPWQRVVEREGESVAQRVARGTRKYTTMPRADGGSLQHNGAAMTPPGGKPSVTTGWRPTCAHAADPVPAVVLDPFAGTGTVGVVAAALSRRAILIDLNAEYLRQCLDRNRQMPLGVGSPA